MTSMEFINLMTASACVDHESSLSYGFTLSISPLSTLWLSNCFFFSSSSKFPLKWQIPHRKSTALMCLPYFTCIKQCWIHRVCKSRGKSFFKSSICWVFHCSHNYLDKITVWIFEIAKSFHILSSDCMIIQI